MGNVLIVEDDRDLLDVLAEIIRDEGYAVTTALDGATALASLRNDRPSLVLLDLVMPGIDGWGVRAQMLAEPGLAEVPVVVFSGVDLERPEEERLQAAAIFNKPPDFPRLLDVIETHCKRVPAQ
jgi:DNA-binding response OmpR family regulator